nr:hypothetical protein [Streptomyces roseoverticillatus]
MAVIGSSLTAVDVVVLLDALGHQGEIHCFSRLRSLPKVQGAPTPWTSRYVTEERVEELTGGGARQAGLAEIAGLFRQEIELATGAPLDWEAALRSARRPVAETLPEDIREAAEGRNRWYAALDATGHLAPRLWHRMDDTAKEVFLAKHASLWAMYRHSMPLPNAEKLRRLVRAGQLHAHTGLRAAVAHGGRHTLTCVEDGREREFGADYVRCSTSTRASCPPTAGCSPTPGPSPTPTHTPGLRCTTSMPTGTRAMCWPAPPSRWITAARCWRT